MMPVNVSIPTVMRKHVGGESHVEADGATLRALFEDLETRYPGVTKNIVDGDQLYRFINVFVNDEDARLLGTLDAPLQDGDEVTILPSVAGG